MSEQHSDTTTTSGTDENRAMTTGELANAMQRGPGERPDDDRFGEERTRAADEGDEHEPLLPPSDVDDLRRQWDDVQSTFVDEPREAVSKADAMVADVAQRLITSFAAERERLEAQWTSGDDVSTEELRLALRRYRSFFERLLAA